MNLYLVRLTDEFVQSMPSYIKNKGIITGKTLFADDETDALGKFNEMTQSQLTRNEVVISNMR